MKPKKSSIIWLFCLLLTAECKDGDNITNEPSGPAPVIADISPERGNSGTEVTIMDSNFGTAPEENTVTFKGKESVVTGAGETELTVVVPPEAGSGLVVVTVAGQTTTGPEFTWLPDNTRFVDGVNGSDQGDDNQCGDVEFPCRTLSHAIEVSFGGDILEIADAEYTESLTIDRPLTLRGESEDGTIIQAHAQPGMATERVITISGDIEVAISDLTIRHGNAPNNQGGGINNIDAMLTVTDVTFTDNSAGNGAGMYNVRSDPVLSNVTFRGNSATLVGVIQGRGMRNFRRSPILTDVSFEDNVVSQTGAGMYNLESSPVLANVIFTGNTANSFGGGMFVRNSSPTLKNVLFFGNESSDGAGRLVCTGNCTTSLMNVTIRSNNAKSGNGGGLLVEEDSELILRNTIVWGNFTDNLGDEIYMDASSEARLFYSLYNDGSSLDIGGQGTFTTENSLTVDPLFVDLNEGNLRLQAGSPAIDACDPNIDPDIFPDGVDLDGNPRIAGGRIDMGAYEHQEN